jgi:ATP-dependent DNA helicase RecG
VGRGNRKSYCILVSDSADEEGSAHDRLQIMHTCYDGYTIAEKDLEMRGPGDFLRKNGDASVRQSGGVHFRLAELCDDTGLLHTAFAEARSLTVADPMLEHYPTLARRVNRMFTLDRGIIN